MKYASGEVEPKGWGLPPEAYRTDWPLQPRENPDKYSGPMCHKPLLSA
jgi:hypothetical protein